MNQTEDTLANAMELGASALREHTRARDEGAEARTVKHLAYAMDQVDHWLAKFKDEQLQEGSHKPKEKRHE